MSTPDDPTGPHDPVHADPASVTADSAQHVHGEDGNSIDGQHRHDHDQESRPRAQPHGHAHDHDHGHEHPTGVKGFLYGLFVPHSHDAADSIDDALEASTAGIRAVKISLVVLGDHRDAADRRGDRQRVGGAAGRHDPQLLRRVDRGPVVGRVRAGRRAATRRYTYGYGRVEDLAGLFIVTMIALVGRAGRV